ncbi:hypothetical protein BB559_001353 [Furculomyces boomerangus]|uniref:Exocyst complex component SEC5 n=1 Tax=Furculomyces boomerangus TaxID=61424 RepID=A0A2T9Z294_9FUNG|nr:hypothetical protein BB559_001353 [Furculomyces boomerangus]
MDFDDSEVLNYYGVESYDMTNWGENDERQDKKLLEQVDNENTSRFNYMEDKNDIAQDENLAVGEDLEQTKQKKYKYVAVYKDYDPLGLLRSIKSALSERKDSLVSTDLAYRAKFFVSHKEFSSTDFLVTLHKDAKFGQLVQGAKSLRNAMSMRSEALKVLVKNNFDRFVEAKNKIDILYDEMKLNSLHESEEYGTKKFTTALNKCIEKAEQIYNPIIERRSSAEKIRSTLSGKFDAAVREYKKGYTLLRHLKHEDPSSVSDLRLVTALDNIVDKIWEEVQESLVELKSSLYRHLGQSYRPIDTQEVVIRHLFDLGIEKDEDPVGYYLERQHIWIIDQMQEVFDSLRRKQANLQKSVRPIIYESGETDEKAIIRRSEELKRALQAQGIADYNAGSTVRDEDFAQWRLIFSAVRSLSTTIIRCVPDFWRLAEAYMDHKYLNDSSLPRDLAKEKLGNKLVQELVLEFGKILFEMLYISPNKPEDNEKANKISIQDIVLGSFEGDEGVERAKQISKALPQTHTLLSGYFMTSIVETIVNSANDIIALKISQQTNQMLAAWSEDSKSFHLQETWKLRYGTDHWPQFFIPRSRQQSNGAMGMDIIPVILIRNGIKAQYLHIWGQILHKRKIIVFL